MADLVIKIPGQIPRKYPLPDSWTYRELQTIKRISGLNPGRVLDALEEGDPDVVIALAVVTAQRAGHNITEHDLMDLDSDAVVFDSTEDEPTPIGADEANDAATETTPAPGGTPDSSESTASDPGNSST